MLARDDFLAKLILIRGELLSIHFKKLGNALAIILPKGLHIKNKLSSIRIRDFEQGLLYIVENTPIPAKIAFLLKLTKCRRAELANIVRRSS